MIIGVLGLFVKSKIRFLLGYPKKTLYQDLRSKPLFPGVPVPRRTLLLIVRSQDSKASAFSQMALHKSEIKNKFAFLHYICYYIHNNLIILSIEKHQNNPSVQQKELFLNTSKP